MVTLIFFDLLSLIVSLTFYYFLKISIFICNFFAQSLNNICIQSIPHTLASKYIRNLNLIPLSSFSSS